MFFFTNRMWGWSLPSSFLAAVKLFFQSRKVLQILETTDVHLPARLKVFDQDHEDLLFTENINFVARTQDREMLQREALKTRTEALVMSKSQAPGGGDGTSISGIAQVNVRISNQDLEGILGSSSLRR
uniref:Prohibitin n=1 Tax=Lotharella oceanica TaxID=641309 RepID=A0A7S2THR2_9EUKA|mmetsp:Transcript_12378/g.23715  ORF Transcript_12378/g.23715 Transcript_12378/m.23715 type:complete len:128 (+) Transcript_12378:3-386(+)